MALVVIAADKGAPGVTTTALALAAVWPRPVLLAECDPSGGDLVYRFPAADGSALDPRLGLLTLAVAARRGLQPRQIWEHTQQLSGGLNVLTGVINAEQGAGLSAFWKPLGELFAGLPGGDVIADCGRLGPDGPQYDLLTSAAAVLLVTRPNPGDVVRLRDRAAAVTAAADARGRHGVTAAVVVIADQRTLRATAAEVGQTLAQGNVPAAVVGGIADDAKAAELLRGQWGGKLDKTMLIRTARETAQRLVAGLPGDRESTGQRQAAPQPANQAQSAQPNYAQPQYLAGQYPVGQQPQYAQPQRQRPSAAQRYPAAPQRTPTRHQQHPSAPQQPPAAQRSPAAQPSQPASAPQSSSGVQPSALQPSSAVQPAPQQSLAPPQSPAQQSSALQSSALQSSALQSPALRQSPGGQQPSAPQQPPAQPLRGAGGRHSASAQPAAAGHEAGDGRWTTR
jgi:hypothetical protein